MVVSLEFVFRQILSYWDDLYGIVLFFGKVVKIYLFVAFVIFTLLNQSWQSDGCATHYLVALLYALESHSTSTLIDDQGCSHTDQA